MAGKISQYTNNGNIENWDLLDYSHEDTQGSGNWETRSITLAQLQTALGTNQLPLAQADQLLTGNRIINGGNTYKLTIDEVTSFEKNSIVNGNDFSTSVFNDQLSQTTVNDQFSASKSKVEANNISNSSNNGIQDLENRVSFQFGHEVKFNQQEETVLIDRIYERNGNVGFYVNDKLQAHFGVNNDVIQTDVVEEWRDGNRCLRIPVIPKEVMNQFQIQNGKFFYSQSDGELAYIDNSGIRLVQHYGQKNYIQLLDNAGTYTWDMRQSYSAYVTPSSGNFNLVINNVTNGDFGNLIFDDTAGSGFGTITLPTTSKVANNGGGTIAFPAGKCSTASFTFYNGTYYWVYAEEYT